MSVGTQRPNARQRLKRYLKDPFLQTLYREIRQAGKIKSASVDITHECNLRCQGCYFFQEALHLNGRSNQKCIEDFIASEIARGTNYFTVLGGEPALALDQLRLMYANFRLVVVTNGWTRIPYRGFENLPIALSVWGDHDTDRALRGRGRHDVFARALQNYAHDPRATWYYTVLAGHAHEIESVTQQCIANGNYINYNFYADLARVGGGCDHNEGFAEARRAIQTMIRKYPEQIMNTRYFIDVVTSGQLYDETWGYDVCASITFDHAANRERVQNGRFYNKHFRAYNADLVTTRRCCIGRERDCATCFDSWAHYSWIMGNMRRHLDSRQAFTNWLTTCYLFYLGNRLVDFSNGIRHLPQIHQRTTNAWHTLAN